jgi:hypothetical protein
MIKRRFMSTSPLALNHCSGELFATRVKRHTARHNVHLPCRLISLSDFRILGERTLDVSTRGAQVSCEQHVRVGTDVLLSFALPHSDRWIDAEAVVTRVMHARRLFDGIRSVGLSFVNFDRLSSVMLASKVGHVPPPLPHRHLRRHYAAWVEHIALSN